MRLLYFKYNGELGIREYIDEREAPWYAILSHRWGADHEEVTLKDIEEGTGRSKPGYEKMIRCGEQTKGDRLRFSWVDTCCIDKTSSAELSEAIESPRHEQLAGSKWFTRGWTLQELLAPSKLNLYDKQWELIGTKDNMKSELSSITGIDQDYLSGVDSLVSACVAQKMSWAATRQTKRIEDVAYCLLGIFDINMSLLYGEGDRAFIRLQHEIIKQTDDHSLFAWTPPNSGPLFKADNKGNFLAQTLAAFEGAGNIVRSTRTGSVRPYSMTNRGLQIRLPLIKCGRQLYAGLHCRRVDDYWKDLAIPVEPLEHGHRYARACGTLNRIEISSLQKAPWRDMLVENATTVPPAISKHDPILNAIIVRTLPWGWKIGSISTITTSSPRETVSLINHVACLEPGIANVMGVIKLVPDFNFNFENSLFQIEIIIYREKSRLLGERSLQAHPVLSRIVEGAERRVYRSLKESMANSGSSSVYRPDLSLIHSWASYRYIRDRDLILVDVAICPTKYDVMRRKVQARVAEISHLIHSLTMKILDPLDTQLGSIFLMVVAIGIQKVIWQLLLGLSPIVSQHSAVLFQWLIFWTMYRRPWQTRSDYDMVIWY